MSGINAHVGSQQTTVSGMASSNTISGVHSQNLYHGQYQQSNTMAHQQSHHYPNSNTMFNPISQQQQQSTIGQTTTSYPQQLNSMMYDNQNGHYSSSSLAPPSTQSKLLSLDHQRPQYVSHQMGSQNYNLASLSNVQKQSVAPHDPPHRPMYIVNSMDSNANHHALNYNTGSVSRMNMLPKPSSLSNLNPNAPTPFNNLSPQIRPPTQQPRLAHSSPNLSQLLSSIQPTPPPTPQADSLASTKKIILEAKQPTMIRDKLEAKLRNIPGLVIRLIPFT